MSKLFCSVVEVFWFYFFVQLICRDLSFMNVAKLHALSEMVLLYLLYTSKMLIIDAISESGGMKRNS
jgi:hypothetical protein